MKIFIHCPKYCSSSDDRENLENKENEPFRVPDLPIGRTPRGKRPPTYGMSPPHVSSQAPPSSQKKVGTQSAKKHATPPMSHILAQSMDASSKCVVWGWLDLCIAFLYVYTSLKYYCTLDAVSNAPTNEKYSLTYQISSYINLNILFQNATGQITTSEITVIYSTYFSL